MRGGKPVIGCSVGYHDFGDYQGVGFQRPLVRAGAIALTLSRVEGTIDEMLDVVDGVMIGGGRDVDPAHYGHEPHPLLGPLDPHRDAFELELVERALERRLPLLGICRGVQVLNVALGGTLVQDLSLRDGWADHPVDPGFERWRAVERSAVENTPEVPEHPRHPISVAAGSRLHRALAAERVEVDSFHHQAIDRLGDGLVVTGSASDGVAEVVELAGDERWLVGAQFELQEAWRYDARFLELYRDFLAAAGARA